MFVGVAILQHRTSKALSVTHLATCSEHINNVDIMPSLPVNYYLYLYCYIFSL